jgi:hypothetical protein
VGDVPASPAVEIEAMVFHDGGLCAKSRINGGRQKAKEEVLSPPTCMRVMYVSLSASQTASGNSHTEPTSLRLEQMSPFLPSP